MTLVTGGSGFIGSHLLERLSALGTPVRATLRRRIPLPRGVEAAECDLATGAGVEAALRGVTTVFHLAGVIKALTPAGYYAGNSEASERLARAAAGRDIRFVLVSSLAAAGPCGDDAPVSEDSEPRPLTHYGKSKLEGERVVRNLLPDAVIVRPPVVYGPRDTGVFRLLKSVSQGLVLEIAGGDRWFSSIYVEDLVDGLLAAANAPQAAGRTYFAAHPKPSTWRDLGAAAARIMSRSPRRLSVPVPIAQAIGGCAEIWSRFTGRPSILSRDKIAEACCRRWVCDTRRAARELGFEAGTSLENGLAKTLAWYREAGWLKY
jgi:nucleoside-diphosphate-sugar epimerase